MQLTYQTLLAVGFGGFFGSIARVYMSSFISKLINTDFPFGILVVNILGSLLIGIVVAIFIQFNINQSIKLFIIAGFLGGFTTFSTFAFDSFLLFQNSFFLGISNVFLNLFGTIIAVAIGYKLTTYLLFLSKF